MPLKRFTSMDRWLTPGLRDCVETRFAAAPPDVRKGCALPARVDGIRGYAPTQGRSPGMMSVLPPVGRSRDRTSGGTAANRSFYTVSITTECRIIESRFVGRRITEPGADRGPDGQPGWGGGSDWILDLLNGV